MLIEWHGTSMVASHNDLNKITRITMETGQSFDWSLKIWSRLHDDASRVGISGTRLASYMVEWFKEYLATI